VLATRFAIAVVICAHASSAAQQESGSAFGTRAVIPGGLRGDVYHLPATTTKIPDFRWLNPLESIYTDSLNVLPRASSPNWPGIKESLDWFAIDYSGQFWLESAGVYRFAVTSGSGTKLYIDGELIVDNDGLHPPQAKMTGVMLKRGIHQIRVSYFQGPGEAATLILQVAGPGEDWRIFSMDRFKPPPNPRSLAYPYESRRSLSAAIFEPGLSVSSVMGTPGEPVRVEISITSPPGKEVFALEWEIAVPAQALESIGDEPAAGRAAVDSGRVVRCSKLRNEIHSCTLSGGREPITNGPIAVFYFKIRNDARPGPLAFRIQKVEAVTAQGGRQSTLDDAEGTITVIPPRISWTEPEPPSSAPVVSVSVSPTRASLHAAQGIELHATVANSGNTAVTWSMTPTVGRLFAVGYYVAPPSIASTQTVSLTATSIADPTKSATAVVELIGPPGASPISVSLTPSAASLSASEGMQFHALVSNTRNRAVTWSVTPPEGTLFGDGYYVAPSGIPEDQTIRVTATSVADPTRTATAVITLRPQPLQHRQSSVTGR
jgi:hypothetical protein